MENKTLNCTRCDGAGEAGMMKVSPGIFYAWKSHGLKEAADDHIHFWYDSMNDCYQNKMPIDMICAYVQAIGDEDYE